MSEDHRRIQTAVIDHKDSDLAVILPMDAAELTRWREQHPRFTYWCGTLLGGCGEPLTDRLYRSKVCHFAHHPHHTCTRTANGEDSADHLFMKSALNEWMRSQKLKGTVQWSRNATSLGEAIDVDLPDRHRRLRFRLRPGSSGSWATDRGKPEEVDWIFGLDGPIPREFFDGEGYVFRIRFETRGARRCPYLGVQRRSGVTTWTPFGEATLTDEGLTTTAVQEIRGAYRRAAVARDGDTTADKPSSEIAAGSENRIARQLSRDELVVAVREALQLDARWATRATWKRLGQSLGTDFAQYSLADLRDLLTDVDSPFPLDEPVLSALMRSETGEPLPYLDDILEALGLGRPSSTSRLKRWVQREVDRAFAKYGVPARAVPPALPLDASTPETLFVDHPGPARRHPPARSQRARPTEARRHAQSDRSQLQHLIAQGQELTDRLQGKTKTRLKSEIRSARRWLQDTRNTKLNDRGLRLLRETIAGLETAIEEAKKAAQPREKTQGESEQKGRPLERTDPTQQQREARAQPAEAAVAPAIRKGLRQRLIEIAEAGGTTNWPFLAGVKNTPEEERRRLLSAIEDGTHDDAPLLSALVVAPGGGPVPYFRGILQDTGLAVPRSDEALLRIWRREQERAYAVYANPPRPLLPRLVPKATAVHDARGSA
ncbi:competence protein CoiA family protein [Streptomyces sp. NPDC048384]|uniref:competence protein CoiA family protein n=1 Tax=Streptomyces sp. NPDC048384 TaxID=3155487 RepID=UPI00342B886B